MTVKELIIQLLDCDMNAPVYYSRGQRSTDSRLLTTRMFTDGDGVTGHVGVAITLVPFPKVQ